MQKSMTSDVCSFSLVFLIMSNLLLDKLLLADVQASAFFFVQSLSIVLVSVLISRIVYTYIRRQAKKIAEYNFRINNLECVVYYFK